jgi:hypothetical protein
MSNAWVQADDIAEDLITQRQKNTVVFVRIFPFSWRTRITGNFGGSRTLAVRHGLAVANARTICRVGNT